MNHEKECECYACKHGIDAMHELENKSIKKYGWFVHVVGDDHDSPTGFNAHTHHLMESFDHSDIQVVIPLDGNTLLSILHTIVDKYPRRGIKLETGKRYGDVIGGNYEVMFVDAKESGREVLRMILPDRHGNLDRESMVGNYDKQFNDLIAKDNEIYLN